MAKEIVHEDFGEKIGGAKKDLWAARGLYVDDLLGMNEREADKYVKKDNVWKKPDYNALIQSGVPVDILYFRKVVRDSLNASLRYLRSDDTPEKRLARQREYIATVRQVQEFDARQHTIIIKSCAPAPLWELQKDVNTQQPEMMVSSAICQNREVLSAWQDGSCDMAILPFPIEGAQPFLKENLFVCVPPDHELAKYEALTFADINGFNFLLRTELGFWDTLCREKMPASKFLVQPDAMVFEELVNASSLPCFTTDYVRLRDYPNRVNIPLSDEESHVTFYLAKR